MASFDVFGTSAGMQKAEAGIGRCGSFFAAEGVTRPTGGQLSRADFRHPGRLKPISGPRAMASAPSYAKYCRL